MLAGRCTHTLHAVLFVEERDLRSSVQVLQGSREEGGTKTDGGWLALRASCPVCDAGVPLLAADTHDGRSGRVER